tara:strand:+ start:1069 stop:1323 length:255 start_codon:yes stop_codon:yes gene_type:complete
MSSFILYTLNGCPHCDEATELLNHRDRKHIIMELNREHPTLQGLKDELDWKTVPIIFEMSGRDQKFIGGYTDLVDYLEGEDNGQ